MKKKNKKNVRATRRQPRCLWPLVRGLSRRPMVGDVLIGEAVNDGMKRLVWWVDKHGVRWVPFNEREPHYVEGSINPRALHFYRWIENRRGLTANAEVGNAPQRSKP